MKNKKWIIGILLSIIIIAAGVIVYGTIGFNYTKVYSGMRLWDIIGEHAIETLIATLVITIYFGIRYRKQNSLKVILTTLISVFLVQAVAISLMIITRLPISKTFLPMLLTVLIANVLVLTNKFENVN